MLCNGENKKEKVGIIFSLFISPFLLSVSYTGISQDPDRDMIRFMFYNTENLFDPFDDSLTLDDEFTPTGTKHWTYTRFQDKLLKVYRVIVSAGDWHPPALIGLCEVENAWVLSRLVDDTPLSKYAYRYVHHESSDRRGMDVALLYDPKIFRYISDRSVRVSLADNSATRDILYVSGLLWDSDTVHLLINHWPSRWAGVAVSEPDRIAAALVLKRLADSLSGIDQDPLIIIAGDFNDDRDDKSLLEYLGVKTPTDLPDLKQLYLLETQGKSGIYGTARYQSLWYEFDHIAVSGALLDSQGLSVVPPVKKVHHPGFLLVVDETYQGLAPFRTYRGYQYLGGFSDHLPVYIDLQRGL